MTTLIIIQIVATVIVILGTFIYYRSINKQLKEKDRQIAYWKGLFIQTKKERDQLIRRNNVVIKTINKDTL
jgi:hypothetical protein